MTNSPASIVLAVLIPVLIGCTPSGAPSPGATTDAEPVRKSLTLGIQREPSEGILGFSGGAKRGGGHNPRFIVHESLTFTDEQLALHPQLATELISIERGTWQLNPDGSMDTTWRVQPQARWHDGTPFTSGDVAFGLTVKKDREVPWRATGRPDLMQSFTTPDPTTLVIHWSAPFAKANEAPDLEALPHHLLESLYREDKPNFVNSSRFSVDFVGLGPYRLVQWVPGSHMEFARFADYYRGRPAFDSVTVRFLGDPNTMVANALAGEVDVLLPIGIDIEAGLEMQRRWEGSRHRVRFVVSDFLWLIELQARPEYARPRNGLTELPVRQALYHAVDRQTLADVVAQGLAPVADSWFTPSDALRRDIESAIPQFPFDLRRAQERIAEAGWRRGADGILVHERTGDRFEIELRGNQAGGIEKQLNVVADTWKAIGAQVTQYVVPTALEVDAEHAATLPGGVLKFQGSQSYTDNRLHSRETAAPTNRWSGRNRGGYVNPRLDETLDRLAVTVEPRERIHLHRQLLEEGMGDVAVMPLYWEVSPVPLRDGVAGSIGGQLDVISDFFSWSRG